MDNDALQQKPTALTIDLYTSLMPAAQTAISTIQAHEHHAWGYTGLSPSVMELTDTV
jgi:hypothetical protein